MANRALELTGKTFGTLTVVGRATGKDNSCSWWRCVCKVCGKESVKRAGSIKKAKTGCWSCNYKAMQEKTKTKECTECGNMFEAKKPYTASRCSSKCNNAFLKNKAKLTATDSVEGTLKRLLSGMRHRAKKRGLECTVTSDFMIDMLKEQQGRCAQTGVALEPSLGGGYARRNPYLVTVDRIDSRRGYVEDNVQLVSNMYNTCKGVHEDSEVLDFAITLLKNKGYKVSLDCGDKEGTCP